VDPLSLSFDPAVFAQLVAMDRDMPGFLGKLADRFLDSAPALISSVAGVTDESTKDVERAAHSLKSTSARFGALALSRLAAQTEAAVREGNLDSARALADSMHLEFARISEHIRQHPALASRQTI
jgi:HPt (histidine-containing phosphotransfer) domain-containing protein